MPPALQFLVLTFAGWVNRHQDDLIDYLREEIGSSENTWALGATPDGRPASSTRVRGHKLAGGS